jgi:hypothetical protein
MGEVVCESCGHGYIWDWQLTACERCHRMRCGSCLRLRPMLSVDYTDWHGWYCVECDEFLSKGKGEVERISGDEEE